MLQEGRQSARNPLALTVEETAELLGMTERATRQAIWRGKIPVRRLGKKVLVLRDELERFLKELPR